MSYYCDAEGTMTLPKENFAEAFQRVKNYMIR